MGAGEQGRRAMFFRIIFGLPGAAIITALLFLAMGWMIRQEGEIGTPPPIIDSILPKIKDTPPDTTLPPRQKLPDQPTPPDIDFVDPAPNPGPTIPIEKIPSPADPDGKIVIIDGTRPTIRPPAIYPENCRAKGAQGVVMVEFDVTAEGAVVNPRIVASENSCLDRAALQTISKWKYTPQTDADGRAIPQRGLRQTFNFQLTE